MENDPWSDDPNTAYIPIELKTPGFLFDVKEAETALNETSVDSPHVQSTLINFEEVLNDHLDFKYLGTTADVTGRAYFADHEGNIIYDDDDMPKNDIISAQSLSYTGIELVYLEYDSDQPIFKAMCRFSSKDSSGNPETLYFAPDDLILFTPKREASSEIKSSAGLSPNEQNAIIKSILQEHAASAKNIQSSLHFKSANSEEQAKILRSCAKTSSDFIKTEYGDRVLDVWASEFLFITESGIMHVNQKRKPVEDWNLPVGQLDACTFYELVSKLHDTEIDAVFKHQPLIVLVSYVTGCQYLIPISAFESADEIFE